MTLHSHKATATERECAHLQFYRSAMPHDEPLLSFDREDVLDALDKESPLVQGLLQQISTYDCTRERIVGLIFDRQTVLAEVLRCPRSDS